MRHHATDTDISLTHLFLNSIQKTAKISRQLFMVELLFTEHLQNSFIQKTVDKAVCTEESGAARLEAVLVALVERKARALHAEHARRPRNTHPLLLLLRDHRPEEEASMIGRTGDEVPSFWCEHEAPRCHHKKLTLQTPHGHMLSPDQMESERRRRRRRRRHHPHTHKPKKHRT
ncbi:unnamed protein product, partial [Leptidea sinapis]